MRLLELGSNIRQMPSYLTQDWNSIHEAAKHQPRMEYSFERKIGQRVRLSSGAVGIITSFNEQLTFIYCERLGASLVGFAQNTELYEKDEPPKGQIRMNI